MNKRRTGTLKFLCIAFTASVILFAGLTAERVVLATFFAGLYYFTPLGICCSVGVFLIDGIVRKVNRTIIPSWLLNIIVAEALLGVYGAVADFGYFAMQSLAALYAFALIEVYDLRGWEGKDM